jgi:DNA ligase 1
MRGAEPTLTVGDLDRAITAVSEATGAGSAARRKHILGDLLCRATDEEAGFMKRLLTGELRQGALAGLMVDAVAKAAGGPASTRAPGTDALRRSHAHGRGRSGRGRGGSSPHRLRAVRPNLPMLASTAENVGEAVASFDRASVEWKLDGIRIQLHRRGDEVQVFTRNLNEITHALPGSSTPDTASRSSRPVLDGEAQWMGERGPAAFQDEHDRRPSRPAPGADVVA